MKPCIWVISRNHNAYNLTEQFIKEIQKIDYPNMKICIVDDGSCDGSGNRLWMNYQSNNIIIHKLQIYLEYCRSLNVGIRLALRENADYVFLVNNDTKDFSPNYFDEVLKIFDGNPLVGMVGTTCYDYNGNIMWNATPKDKFGIPMEIPTCGYMIKRNILENIGGLDENLIRYFEDLDFIIRLRSCGFQTAATDKAEFKHMCHGMSGRQRFVPNYYRMRNLIWFLRRYCNHKSSWWRWKHILYNFRMHWKRAKYPTVKGTIIGMIKRWHPKYDL